MAIRIGINGFGQIGRAFVRHALSRDDIEVAAVNDIRDARILAHLLEFDSDYGWLPAGVKHSASSIIVDGAPILVLGSADPAEIDWGWLGVDIVVEATGRFLARDAAAVHLKNGARKVLLPAAAQDADLQVAVGVNDADYDPRLHDLISNASSTTSCVALMAKVLGEEFGLEQYLTTTVHADAGDPTGAGPVIPEPASRLRGVVGRVPALDGSLTEVTAVLGREVTAGEVNRAFEQASAGPLAGIMGARSDPLGSRDILGSSASCVFDSGLTRAAGSLARVFGWHDDAWSYTCRLADLAAIVGGQI
jgi:glyceraldehyde 3-phosphate dehydrogenase